MDVLLVNASAYALPSSQRVGAIVYDGAVDLRLWPGPGSDRDLLELYGTELRDVLEVQRKQLEGGQLELGQCLRLHPGKLHCDFLLWFGTRAPEKGTAREGAPSKAALEELVLSALRFVSTRHVTRIAFPAALGSGPGELPLVERLELIVRAATQYGEACRAEGKSVGVEEVLVCEPSASVVSQVKRRVANLAKQATVAPRVHRESDAPPKPRRASTAPAQKARRGKPTLDEADVQRARAGASPYDTSHSYRQGEWFVHARFGAGRVEQVTPEGAILVLFEDGEQRKMTHGRR